METKKVLNELLVDLFYHILRLEEKNLKDNGVNLSMTEVHAIEAIKKVNFPSMSNVAKYLKVTVGTLTITINRLVRKGYVERYRNERDKRIIVLLLTEKGEEVFQIHEEFHERMVDSLLSDLNVNDDKNLIKSLKNLQEFFNSLESKNY
jgi:DNA-binding MarR family transcriptional regulator